MNKEKIMENIIKYKSETHEVAVDKYECGYARPVRSKPSTSNGARFSARSSKD
jgi:hypothetical protein